MGYNGHKNYETWNVCLWISNDEGFYQLSTECANYDEFIGQIRDMGILETPDGVSWTDSGLDYAGIDRVAFAEDADDVEEFDEDVPQA
jgi:hypothetical protein